MKRCSSCGEMKPKSTFGKDKSRSDGLNPYCKECANRKSKDYYKNNLDFRDSKRIKQNEYNKRYMVGYRERVKDYINEQIKPCVKCGENRKYVIDFHHINPKDKSFTIQSGNRCSKDVIHNEIKKCVCLCRNCHAEYHHLYGLHPSNPIESLTEYLGRSPYEI